MSAFVTRFAPSPTGLLHLGHAYSALTAFDAAQAAGGRFLLRIEDIDAGRCRPDFETAIYDDLAWLGLAWETPVRRQSEHVDAYHNALARLADEGLVYRCFKTRKEVLADIARAPHLAPDGPEGPAYTGAPLPANEERRLLDQAAPFAWRLSQAAARAQLGAAWERLEVRETDAAGHSSTRPAQPQAFGDVVLGRKDSGASYHLAAVWDDALQNITHVIRGEDLRAAADLHRLLQALLGLPTPIYRHHKLIMGADGKRLAKRDKAATLTQLRADGVTPAAIRAQLGLSPA